MAMLRIKKSDGTEEMKKVYLIKSENVNDDGSGGSIIKLDDKNMTIATIDQ